MTDTDLVSSRLLGQDETEMQKKLPPDPNQLHALLQQAWKLHQSGQLAKADKLYRNILSVAPAHPDANSLMGLLCIQSKRPELAAKYIQKALRSDPDNAQSHYNLGIACADQGHFEEAASHFGRAVKLQPANADALSSQGNALRLSGDAAGAVEILQSAIGLDSANHGIRHNLGQALNDLGASLVKTGKSSEAIGRFRQALEYTPHHPQALANLGLTLEQQGNLGEAARHYKAAIEARPDFAEAHFFLSHLRTHRSSPEEIKAMKRLFNNPETPDIDQIRLAFGLGFALESAENYAEAFHFMTEGHRLQGRGSRFSLEQESRRFDAIKQAFPANQFSSMEQAGLADKRPVFIVGMPRSGTTLAEQILSSHPHVHGAGEQTMLAEITRSLHGAGYARGQDAHWQKAALKYLDHVAADAGKALRITDTTPMNFLNLGVAASLFPQARFVICLRDPMDNCLSIYRQYLTGANNYTHRLEDLGAYYLLHRSLVDHWASVFQGRVHLLHYEHLIAEHEQETRGLLNFCGLDYDPRCLEFHQSERRVRSPSAAQVRQPIYATSIGAWKRYEKELAPLRRALNSGESLAPI